MARGKNTFNFSGGFNINSQEPIDSRFVVGLLSDLTSSATWTSDQLYNGLTVAVEESGKLYILLDRDNFQLEDSWREVGSGKGTVIVPTFNDASVYAIAEGQGQLIYVQTTTYRLLDEEGHEYGEYLTEEPVGEEGVDYRAYYAGAYISNGGTIDKMAQSTASGDIEGDVTELKGDVAILDASVAELDASVADIQSKVDILDGAAELEGSVKNQIAAEDASMKSYVDGIDASIREDLETTIAAEDASMKSYVDGIDASLRADMADAIAQEVEDRDAAIAAEDASMKSYVDGIDASIREDLETAIAAEDASLVSYIDAGLAEKLNAADTSIYTGEEKAKLANIEEGAQVNIIETVKVNGVALDVTDKAVNVEIPDAVEYKGENAIEVSEVADNSAKVSLKIADSSILHQDAAGLKATLSIEYNNQHIQLKGYEGALVSEFDASMFIKDGMIEDASLVVVDDEHLISGLSNGTYIRIVFNSASSKDPIYINVTSLIDVYTAGNGIEINGKAISVKKDVDDEGYLTVSSTGIKVTGIDSAISDAVSALENGKVKDLSTALDSVISDLAKTDASLASETARIDTLVENLLLTDSSLSDVSTRLSETDASLSILSDKMDELVEELSGDGFVKSVEIAVDSSNALEASTDASGNVFIKVTSAMQNVLSGFNDKLDAEDITTGATNGSISVKGVDVPVYGLKSAAFEDASAFMKYNDMDWRIVES